MQSNYNIIPKSNNYVLKKEMISINSNDRDIRKWSNSNNFEINLPTTIQNVNYIKLKNITLPMNSYNIASSLQNTKFRFLFSGTTYNIELQDGFYSATNLATTIQNLMNAAVNANNFIVIYNKINNKFLFGSNTSPFSLIFNYQPEYSNCLHRIYPNYANWGLGFILGFEKNTYNSTNTTTPLTLPHQTTAWLNSGHFINAPNQFIVLQYNTIYLELDRHNYISEIQPYSQSTASNYNNDLAFKVNSAFAKIPIPLESAPTMVRDENNNFTIVNLNESKFICNSGNYYPPIKSISKLKFKFRYHDGTPVQFNTLPVSFVIEIGVLQEEQRRLADVRRQF